MYKMSKFSDFIVIKKTLQVFFIKFLFFFSEWCYTRNLLNTTEPYEYDESKQYERYEKVFFIICCRSAHRCFYFVLLYDYNGIWGEVSGNFTKKHPNTEVEFFWEA